MITQSVFTFVLELWAAVMIGYGIACFFYGLKGDDDEL
jgi:hypothetical protein